MTIDLVATAIRGVVNIAHFMVSATACRRHLCDTPRRRERRNLTTWRALQPRPDT